MNAPVWGGVVGGWWRRGRLGAWATGSEEEEEDRASVSSSTRPGVQAKTAAGRGEGQKRASAMGCESLTCAPCRRTNCSPLVRASTTGKGRVSGGGPLRSIVAK